LCISNNCLIFASEKGTNNKLNPKTRKGTEIMKTYIVQRIAYTRNSNGYYDMSSSVIVNVFTDKAKAIEAAQNDLNNFKEKYHGIESERSCFDNEVFNHTLESGKVKGAYLVTEHEVAA